MCAVKKNGTKIKPLIVHPTKSAQKMSTIEVKNDRIIGYSAKGWVTQLLLAKYLDAIVPFGQFLLIWDHCSAHVGDAMKSYQARKGIKVIEVPKGATGYCQVADVGLIRGFKSKIKAAHQEFYESQIDQAIASDIEAGSLILKKPGINVLRDWIVEYWNETSLETVEKTLNTCYFAENKNDLHLMKMPETSNYY